MARKDDISTSLLQIRRGIDGEDGTAFPKEFGGWSPDLPPFGNPGSPNAKNAIPHQGGYKQFLGLSSFTDALTARCQGAATFQNTAGNFYPYAGDATKLYRLDASSFTDVSNGTYTIPADEFWEFTQFGNKVIAVNSNDAAQGATIGTGSFSDHFTSTLKPKARHVMTLRNFLVVGNVEEGGNAYPNRVRWSASGDSQDMDQSITTLADAEDLEDGGWVQKLVSLRDYGVVFQEKAISRMSFEGSPTIFRFDKVEENRGALVPGGVVPFGNGIFVLSDDGFYVFGSDAMIPIGDNRVDKFFFDDLNDTYKHRIIGAIDRDYPVVMWAYPSGSSSGTPDRIIMYNWTVKQWAFADVDTQFMFTSASPGLTLEQLDSVNASLDALPFSLDSRVWQGGAIARAGFDTSNQLGFFDGTALTAELDTAEMQPFPGRRAFYDRVWPLIEGSSATVTHQIGTRSRLIDSVSFSSAVALDADGTCPVNVDARYARHRLNIAGGFDNAQGLLIRATPTGSF